MIGMDVKLALASMRSTKVRAAMTMIAIVIGVTGYVLVTSFVDGLKTSITTQIGEFGANLITVNSGELVTKDENGDIIGFNPAAGFGGISTLTEMDVASIKKLEGVEYAAPQMLISLSETIESRGSVVDGAIVAATNSDYPFAFNHKVDRGKFFDDDETRKVAVIGSAFSDEMFPGGLPLGAQITLRQQKFTVIALLEELEVTGALSAGTDLNNIVIIPLDVGKKLNGGAVSINEIDLQAVEGADIDEVVSSIEAALLQNHGGAQDFTVLKQEDLIGLTGSLLDSVKIVSQSLSYIMLFVGGIVIALIMLITVKERTREIGIRKSIGATNNNIRTQFLVEAVVLSWFGSIIGLIIAYLAGLYLASISDITPTYTLGTVVSVIIISTVIGSVSGIVPAMSAAKKDPVEALRFE